MLIREIISINETTKTSFDINELARFVEENLSNFVKQHPDCDKFTIQQMSSILDIPIPGMFSTNIRIMA